MQETHGSELTLLETFVAVVESGGIVPASRRLNLSQPATSRRIQRLEEQLGVALFERTAGKLIITESGRTLASRARVLLRDVRSAMELDHQHIEFRLGTFPTVASHLLLPFVVALQSKHPGYHLQLSLDSESVILRRLLQGELDAAVLVGKDFGRDFEVTALGNDLIRAAIKPSLCRRHRIVGPNVSVASLKRLNMLVWDGFSDTAFSLINAFSMSHGLMQPRGFRVPHIETLRNLACEGAGYVILPAYTLRRDVRHGLLQSFAIEGLRQRLPFALVRRKSQRDRGGVDRAIDLLKCTVSQSFE